ncbi:MAG: TolC family protein [Peptostreptococcaceae bacterium]|nr:TolC family protein [Peptostreptococcaceae bacterium]
MKRNIKNIVAVTAAAALLVSSSPSAFAMPIYNKPVAPPKTTKAEEQKTEKKLLTIDEAIKSAVNNNLNLKKFEVTRESLLKKIDQNYSQDKSIFELRTWQENNLANLPDGPEKEKAKQQLEQEFNKAMAGSDVVMAQLVNQRGTIDISKVMEREGVHLSIRRLFTSIMQKEKDIEILGKKIAQDKKNMQLYEKQFELGKISQSKLKEQALETTKNENLLKIEQGKLQNYYNELENLTQISSLQSKYTLEKPSIDYRPIELSEASQKAQQERAADYNLQVISKVADTKIKESVYQNYPYVATESSYVELRDQKDIAQLDESQAKRDAKYNAQVKYNDLQELQQNILLTEKNITKIENQLKDLRSKYDLGLVAKNVVDNSVFALDEAKNGLDSLKIRHYQLRIMYENAYFAGQ